MRQTDDVRGSVDYVVEPDEKHWTVSCGGDRCGWFGDRKSALKSAVADARRVRVRGFPISVHVRRHDGSVRRLPEPLIRS